MRVGTLDLFGLERSLVWVSDDTRHRSVPDAAATAAHTTDEPADFSIRSTDSSAQIDA